MSYAHTNSFFWQILWCGKQQWLLNAYFWCITRIVEAAITISRLLIIWTWKSYFNLYFFYLYLRYHIYWYIYISQGQLLTLVEYLLLLYRALLPTPVWYQFFLNKEYGSFFSSLTTGLYLTFKLTSVVEKVLSIKITQIFLWSMLNWRFYLKANSLSFL